MRHTLLAMLSLPTAAFAQSAYINKVYDFRPAPGQFVNVLPEWEEGDTESSMAAKAEACIANHAQSLISLGGFGGYVIFGFDHTIENQEGRYDFTVLGNAIYANNAAHAEGGSAEPGIVMVSQDVNHNGLPDDPWYELAGSEYQNPKTTHHYSISYSRPDACHQPVTDPANKLYIDTQHIAWNASDGTSGYIPQNAYHRQNYYPNWITDNTLTFSGTLLPNNAIDESGKGTMWVLYCYGFGYADNHPNADERNKFNIEWAVDDNGNHVHLDGIDFVKVHTALNQTAGWLGETSTEILDAWDLHILGGDDTDSFQSPETPSHLTRTLAPTDARTFTLSGQQVSDSHGHGLLIRRLPNGKSFIFQH